MAYRRYPQRSTLTPPAELVGQFVRWAPKHAVTGQRLSPRFGSCLAYNAEARTLTIAVPCDPTPWNDGKTGRDIEVPLSCGPFTVA